MKDLLKLLMFLTYTIIVFLTSNYYVLGVYFILNILLMLIVKVSFIKTIKNILYLLPFILFASITNLLLADIQYAILIAVRLLIVCNATYSFTHVLTTTKLANAIEKLFFPLKIFRVNPKDISLMICISIAFIPILGRELQQIKYALKSKGMKIRFKNFKYILKPFLYGVFKRTDEVTDALESKAIGT